MQEFIKESPFFLMYGCDVRLPTTTALSWPMERSMVDLKEHGEHLATSLADTMCLCILDINARVYKRVTIFSDVWTEL